MININDRNASIRHDREVGHLSLREIAEKYGLTHQRVSQLLHGMGVVMTNETSARERARRARKQARLVALEAPVKQWLAEKGPYEIGLKTLAKSLGAKLNEVYIVAHAQGWSGQPQVDLLAEGKRRCAGECRRVLALADFHKNSDDRQGGRSRVCKECISVRLHKLYLRKKQAKE